MSSIATFLLYLLFIVSLNCHVSSIETSQAFLKPLYEMQKMKMIKQYLQNINKHVKKTIMSVDGDIIDCILFHKQPAFYHPLLKGNIPIEPPKIMNELHSTRQKFENFQSWNTNGEKCPQATIPIKRSTEDVIRARTKFTTDIAHDYAVVYSPPGRYTGAKADLNLWTPHIADPNEFSLSQIWVTAGKFGVDLNTVEVGWHADPLMNGDNRPRLFVFWTADNYRATGCYNLHCPGFVHTNPRIALGARFSAVSTYNGDQYDATFKIEKDPKNGNWLLLFGSNNEEIGYWPKQLFNILNDSATRVSFGGEVLNMNSSGIHTATQMGSGHFAKEQFGKAAYVKNIEVFDWENRSIPLDNLEIVTEHPNCYNVQLGGKDETFGTFFYFGGPGRSDRCR